MTNDKSLATLSLNFMLREVNFHQINELMGSIADNGLTETSKDTLDQLLQMFDEYRDASITFRESVVDFLKKTEKAPDLAVILQAVLDIDGKHLELINAVDDKLEYFLKAAIKKSAADRLAEQIDFFMENPDSEYNPNGETTEEETDGEEESEDADEEQTEEETTEETVDEPVEEQTEEETIGETQEETSEEEQSEDAGKEETVEETVDEPVVEEIPIYVEKQGETVEETIEEEVSQPPIQEEEAEEEPKRKIRARRKKKTTAKTKKTKTPRKRRLTWKKGEDGDE